MSKDFDSVTHQEQLAILRDVAKSAVQYFDLPDDVAVTMINLSENATFGVEASDGRRWALRIHRHGYHSKAAIASELAWLMDLRASGVVVTPQPIKGKNGKIIQEVMHVALAEPRYVVISDWESGKEPGIGEDLIKPFEILGQVTANMHAHARQWQRPSFFQRFTWDFNTSLGEHKPHWGRWRDGMGVDAVKAKLFERTVALIGKRLASYGQSNERFGLIHCDLRLANLLIDGDAVKVIDFDDCGFGWYMYDAATPVSFYEHEPQVPDLIEAWKVGYRKAGFLSHEDEIEIPTFIMFRRLLLVAWIGSHSETQLAKSMGPPYSEGTIALCENYLSKFS
jgi:Ser/Thr protein kinase RdoA (MazF antagonist)